MAFSVQFHRSESGRSWQMATYSKPIRTQNRCKYETLSAQTNKQTKEKNVFLDQVLNGS